MKIRKWKYALTVAALLLVNTGLAFANCSVPSAGYPTIQAAVDDPTCAVVDVAPGLYPENVTITRAVTLNGAQAGQAVANRTSGGPAESTVTGANPTGSAPVFLINASSVTLDGFTIKNAVTSGDAFGVQVKPGSIDPVMQNDFFDGIASATGAAHAIYIQNGVSNINIVSNDIRNVSAEGNASALLVGDDDSLAGPEYCFTRLTTINGITSATGGAAAAIYRKSSLQISSIQFLNNTVSNLTGAAWVRGIMLNCEALNFLFVFSDFSNFASASGDITGVWINNNPHGYEGDAGGNNYDLPSNAFGVRVQNADAQVYPPPLSAGCNWWGSPDGPGPVGPGHGCQVSPNVFYFNWRTTPDHMAPCNGSSTPATEADCKTGGWVTHVRPDGTVFKNQGDCLQFINNGK